MSSRGFLDGQLFRYFLAVSLQRVKNLQDQMQELCGAVSKRDEDIPGLTQYRDRISAIVGNLVSDFAQK